ncbi:histone-like nucleoid-structuring protein Lsr2 [Streptomyces violascens]|uniref:histone-like nucleoid-structuring protein Lsr2 n=1 Tax=Streptomyces violascens TaxID=67381 RepID=UPI0036BB167F
MAQKTITIITDDLTGQESPEVTTHSLVVDGISYEIDLGSESHDKLLEAIGPFMKAGRRVSRSKGARKSGKASAAPTDDVAVVRKWAQENGFSVKQRGRVPLEIYAAYSKAHR